jgi:putative tricarboxylic transport membrane protein
MEFLHDLQIGIGVALTLHNLLYALIGAVLGTLAGALPGLGSVAMIAMMLPAAQALDATPALIMLAGIFCGAQYGGSTAAILTQAAHGSSASPFAAAAIDGSAMARKGQAGTALGIAGVGAFVAGCIGTAIVAALAPPLTQVAFRFGPAEYFSLTVLGLIGAVVLASGSLLKGIGMILFGLLLAQIGPDMLTGAPRFAGGIAELSGGIGFAVIAIGVFGIGHVIATLGEHRASREFITKDIGAAWPSKADVGAAWPAVIRGTALGSLLGMLPGAGALLASFVAYDIEKSMRLSSVEVPFGKGNIRGAASAESANNAGVQTSFIPMLALGIPPNAVMALMVGALTLKGIQPGPQVMTGHPDLFWGLIVSLWIANAMLLVINLPLLRVWKGLLRVRYAYVFPVFTLLCCAGAYSLHGRVFDVYVVAIFGVVGYVFSKLSLESAPLLLGYVLGPMMEENLRNTLTLSSGDWSVFIMRPFAAGLLATAALLIVVVMLPSISKKREATFQEE